MRQLPKLRRHSFTTSNVLLEFFVMYTARGELNLNPPYQRGLVWDLPRKEALIDSLFCGLGVPAIYVREFEPLSESEPWMEVLDGKQRISTLVEFVSDAFAFQGWLFSELPEWMQRKFKNTGIGIVRTYGITDEDALEIYDRLNFNGVPHKAEDRRKGIII